MTTPRTMTDTELLDTLAELDKKATRGPWQHDILDYGDGHEIRMATVIKDDGRYYPQHIIEWSHGIDAGGDRGERKQFAEADATVEMIAFLGTHRARLIELARRGLDA